jgi:acetylornithine deacetylase/succinyl-diaminopimelate desuccinylase-like protein
MASHLDDVLARLAADEPSIIARLCDLLRIPSISTDPEHAGDLVRCAEWLVRDLRTMGFNAQAVGTAGHPMVLAHHPGPKGYDGPRVLYYGHYDVQPADPLELWESGPFEPTIATGPHGRRIVARGAVDDKGQVMTFIEAFRAWHAVTGSLPCPVTVMLEGEEESGSASLEPFMRTHARDLAADVAVVSDTGMWDIRTPAITTSLRGLCYIEATLVGPSHDLHSGMYGGAVRNPINALAAMIASLHTPCGQVAVAGFYDGVEEPSPAVRESWSRLGFDDAEFLGSAGVKAGWGEMGRSVLERTWSRPTCDCNGIVGGYTGVGAKTVIPARASTKISCRLVPGQDPDRIQALLEAHLRAQTPPGYSLEIHSHGRSPAIRVSSDSPYLRAAQRALAQVFGREAGLIGTGGSIPAVGAIQRILGMDCILMGFGLDDDRVHSPNEKFEVECLMNGARSQAALLAHLGAMQR